MEHRQFEEAVCASTPELGAMTFGETKGFMKGVNSTMLKRGASSMRPGRRDLIRSTPPTSTARPQRGAPRGVDEGETDRNHARDQVQVPTDSSTSAAHPNRYGLSRESIL